MGKDKSVTAKEVDDKILAALQNRLGKEGATLKTIDPKAGELGRLGTLIDVAKPTGSSKDSSRLTIHVPCGGENSYLNLGSQAGAPEIYDNGIVAKTKSHIHWHTTAMPTYVGLGIKSADGSMSDGAIDGSPTLATGYLMLTNGHASHESTGQHYLTSSNGDVVVRSMKQSLQLVSDTEQAILAGKKAVTVGSATKVAIVADGGLDFSAPNYPSAVAHELPDTAMGLVGTSFQAFLSTASTILAALNARSAYTKATAPNNATAMQGHAKKAAGALIAAVAKTNATVASFAVQEPSLDLAAPLGRATMGALFSTCWGKVASLLAGGLTADVAAATASVTGATYAGLSAGIGASVEGLLESSVNSTFGETFVGAKKSVFVTSDTANAQVEAMNGMASLRGKTAHVYGADCMKAAAKGWGMVATNNSITMGALPMAHEAKKEPASSSAVLLKEDLALLKANDDCAVTLTRKDIFVTAENVDIDVTKHFSTSAKKILLG